MKEEKIEMLTKRINDLVEQAEHLGCEGKVEEAQGVLKLCEQLRDDRTQLSNVSCIMIHVGLYVSCGLLSIRVCVCCSKCIL